MGNLRKVKCWDCGYVYDLEDAPTESVLVDSGESYKYYETYHVCPECGSEDYDDFTQLSEDCDGVDCYGDCENCEIKELIDREGGAE